MQYVAPVFILTTQITGIVAMQYVAPVFILATPHHRYCCYAICGSSVYPNYTDHRYCCYAICGSSVYPSYTRSQVLLLCNMWLQCLSKLHQITWIVAMQYVAPVIILTTPDHRYCCYAVCGSSVYPSYTRPQVLLLCRMWFQCLSSLQQAKVLLLCSMWRQCLSWLHQITGIVAMPYVAPLFILATTGHRYCCCAVCGSSVYPSYTRSQVLLLCSM